MVAKFATNASGVIWWPILQVMQVGHLVAKFVTNASSAIWWPNLEPILIALHVGQIWNQFWWSNFELIQVEPHTIGQIWNQCSGILFSWIDNSSCRLYTLGPLCLWQCLKVRFLHLSGQRNRNIHPCLHILKEKS